MGGGKKGPLQKKLTRSTGGRRTTMQKQTAQVGAARRGKKMRKSKEGTGGSSKNAIAQCVRSKGGAARPRSAEKSRADNPNEKGRTKRRKGKKKMGGYP